MWAACQPRENPMYELRDGAQSALNTWMKPKVGTLVLTTGYGKTRLGVYAHNSVHSKSTLIVTSKTPIKNQWKKEFDLIGHEGDVEYLCIQSAYKASMEVDLLIIDECHKALSPKFRNVFSTIKYKYLLCLTATWPTNEEYSSLLEEVSPLLYTISIPEAVEHGAIAPCKVINKKITLDAASRYKYNLFNRQFSEASIQISSIVRSLKMKGTIFDVAKAHKEEKTGDLGKYSRQYWAGMSMRKMVLYKNPNKLVVCKEIVERNPGRVWIIFVKTIEFATQMSLIFEDSRVYHSKLKTAERENVLKDYDEGKFDILIAVDALTEGLNVERVDAAISASGNSSILEQIQRQGRASRWGNGKLALFYNLYVPNTPEERWITTKTLNLQVTYE